MEMELDFIKKYVITSLRQNRRQAEKLFKSKYDPFYKWKIGDVSERAIEELFFSFLKNENKTVLNDYMEKQFGYLKESFEQRYKSKNNSNNCSIDQLIDLYDTLTIQDWYAIRTKYQEIKNSKFEPPPPNHTFEPKEYFNSVQNSDFESNFELRNFYDNVQKIVQDYSDGNWSINLVQSDEEDEYLLVISDDLHPTNELTHIILPIKKELKKIATEIDLESIEVKGKKLLKGIFQLA